MSVKQSGFSLPEMLIAMAISAVLLLGSARFLPALQWAALRQTRQQSLENELWQRIYTVAKHLQRAGYCRGLCRGQALYIAGGGDCLLVSWDSNSDGVWNSAPSSESDTTGFRLRDGALETLRGASACSGKGWGENDQPGGDSDHRVSGYAPGEGGLRAGIIDYAGGALGRRPANPRAGGIRRNGV